MFGFARKFAGFLFFVLLGVAPLSVVFAQTSVPVLYSKGMIHFSEGEYTQALDFFKKIYTQDPHHADNLYLLGVTHLKLKQYAPAVRFLGKLLTENPNYTKAYFDYGLSLFERNKWGKALDYFGKELDQTENPYPVYFAALSHYYLGHKEEAITLLQKVKTAFPQSELTASAEEWLSRIIEGKPPPTKPVKIKRWTLTGSASFYLDSNVTSDPDNEELVDFTDRNDYMAVTTLGFRYLLINREKTQFYFDYLGYQSAYFNINFDANRFNYGRHKEGFELVHKFNDAISWRMPGYYSFAWLGMARYLQNGDLATVFDLLYMEHWLLSITGGVRRDEFFQNLGDNRKQDRDATQPYVRAEQYFFAPNNREVYFKAGYGFENNLASGDDWDYKSHHFLYAIHLPLKWKFKFLALGDVVARNNFKYPDSVLGGVRSDRSINHTTVISREIFPWLTASGTYSFLIRDSSLDRFTNRRHVVGLTLSTRL